MASGAADRRSGKGAKRKAQIGKNREHSPHLRRESRQVVSQTTFGSKSAHRQSMKKDQPFITAVTQLRAQARESIEKGAVTPTYQGDVAQTIEILQSVLATEIVCVLRYTMNAISATGISSESVKAEFDQHAREE